MNIRFCKQLPEFKGHKVRLLLTVSFFSNCSGREREIVLLKRTMNDLVCMVPLMGVICIFCNFTTNFIYCLVKVDMLINKALHSNVYHKMICVLNIVNKQSSKNSDFTYHFFFKALEFVSEFLFCCLYKKFHLSAH